MQLRFLVCQKLVFDRPEEVNKTAKTSNSTPKCIQILERGELRSKSKYLAQQAFPHIRQKSEIFATFSPGRRLCLQPSFYIVF